ncbi:hypothetical protein [Cupriavidus metallidurans]|jgi:hypothetical protein|uniref:Uncharacterized protein n=1 Tax=Cupriavidus metallidurans TaxID=119219 RepID=A0A482IMW1_9BURK|nr:hypothetical protein [Cupriavidus metallidurans]QBP10128.1 hypothetical protein DDF84_010350 [Cupriavidus metallidurans]QWC87204.1 hypothetical protein KB891_08890 [Cupriavidus metallidurans]
MKTSEVAVEGDVGQVVAGNVIHEGANARSHLSNVITINNGEPLAPIRTITELQRKRISAKVKEVMQVAGIKQQLEVYSVVLTDFGIEKILDLPRDQFKGVMAMLDSWIAEERSTPAAPNDAAMPTVNASDNVQCAGCAAVARGLGRTHTGMRLMTLGVVGAIGAAGYAVYAKPLPAVESDIPLACHHDGKVYSVGGVMRMPDNAVYECANSVPAELWGQWIPARNPGGAGKRR